MSDPTRVLPPGFEDLEIWVDEWVLPDMDTRNRTRLASPMERLQAFYDAILPQASRVLEFLDTRKLGELDPSEERLLKLMLSFAEVCPAVEFYQQPGVIDGFPAEEFLLNEDLADLEPQT